MTLNSTRAQVENWNEIVKDTKVAVKYFSPIESDSFSLINPQGTQENKLRIIKDYSDKNINVELIFKKYPTHLELFGEILNQQKEDLCITLKIIFPSKGIKNIVWSYDLDSSVIVNDKRIVYSNYVNAKSIIPPAGAFNTDSISNDRASV